MTTQLKQSDLTSIFKHCPDNLLDKETFRKLNALSNELDNIFFLDDSGELAADRDAVIRIAKTNMLLAPDLHEIALLESAKHLGRRLKRKGTGRPLTGAKPRRTVSRLHLYPTPNNALSVSRRPTLKKTSDPCLRSYSQR